MKDWLVPPWFILFMVALIVAVATFVAFAYERTEDFARQCEARGGVMIEGRGRLYCVDAKAIR
jgi:hypothetical protein